jgi:hypothetical protein
MIGAVAALAYVRRIAVEQTAILLWLALYVFAPNFFFTYLIWGIPFFLLAGRVRWALALQAYVLVPMFIAYRRPWEQEWILSIYVPAMVVLWAGFLIAFLFQLRRVVEKV